MDEGHPLRNFINKHESFHARKLISGFIPRCLNRRTVSLLGKIAVVFEYFKKTEFGTSNPEMESWAGFMCAILDDLATRLTTPGRQNIIFRMQMTNESSPLSTSSDYETFEDQVLRSLRYYGILDRAAKVARFRPFVVDGDMSMQFNERCTQEIVARSHYLDAIEPKTLHQE